MLAERSNGMRSTLKVKGSPGWCRRSYNSLSHTIYCDPAKKVLQSAFLWCIIHSAVMVCSELIYISWRSRLAWSRAHDWKSCNGHKPFESSNLSFSATKVVSQWYKLTDYLLILPIRKACNTKKKRDKRVQNSRHVSLFLFDADFRSYVYQQILHPS